VGVGVGEGAEVGIGSAVQVGRTVGRVRVGVGLGEGIPGLGVAVGRAEGPHEDSNKVNSKNRKSAGPFLAPRLLEVPFA